MTYKQPEITMIRATAEALLMEFVRKKYLSDPSIFGLNDFSKKTLESAGFSHSGDPDFSLYDKEFRIAGSDQFVNLKVYFKGEDQFSNGISINGARICRYIDLLGQPENSQNISSIEILWDDSLEFGSILLNSHLDIRFGVQGKPDKRKSYHLLGISTDYEIPSRNCSGRTSTRGARILKSWKHPNSTRIRSRRSARDLIQCVQSNFPDLFKEVNKAYTPYLTKPLSYSSGPN